MVNGLGKFINIPSEAVSVDVAEEALGYRNSDIEQLTYLISKNMYQFILCARSR